MLPSAVEVVLVDFVLLLALAGTVAALTSTADQIPYPIALLVVGLCVSLVGVEFRSDLTPELFSELILLVLVPALLFQGASRLDADRFVENLGPILVLAVVGLPLSVVLLALAGTSALGLPLLVSLLFATIILPTDPVAVLPIFDVLGAPERLSVLVDGESMLNDGVAVVLYATVVQAVLSGPDAAERFTTGDTLVELAVDLGVGVLVAMLGGAVVGAVAGYVVYRFVAVFDDELTMVILSVVLAYGAFLLGEALRVSGVIAVVSAGLFIAERSDSAALSVATRQTFRITWRSAAFVGNTVLFLTIGVVTPFDELLRYAGGIAVAIVLVFLARAVVVYPLSGLVNASPFESIPRGYQHVLVWSGIHVSVPLALVLGLPATVPDGVTEQLRALVFGVATFTLVVQGLTMESLLHRVGIVTRST